MRPIHLLISAPYKLFVCLINLLTYFLITYLLNYLPTYFRNMPVPFPGRMRACVCCVRFNFSVLSQEIGWKERIYFVSDVT